MRPTRRVALPAALLALPAAVLVLHAVLRAPVAAAPGTTPSAPATTSPAPATTSPTTYYVSAAGSDSNRGTSPDQAWRTVNRVDQAALQPGDSVLFEGGRTFSDDALMPSISGTGGAPIVFGTYGPGQATITWGVWFINQNYLVFDNLRLGPGNGFQGGRNETESSDHITITHCTIELGADDATVGIYSSGDDWTIKDSLIENIGNSGMLLNGARYIISGNRINEVGLDAAIPYGKHGIYLRVADASVTDNTITNFSSDGISPRFRNSTITGNHISGGGTGIGFFPYDPVPGTSRWTDNTITDTADAGIYVNGGSGGLHPTRESFVIAGNTIQSSGLPINLEPTTGVYHVRDNHS